MTDWANMQYPTYLLRNGSAKGDGPLFHTDLRRTDIVYGDLRGDGSLMAFVPVFSGTGEGVVHIYVVDADASCHPRLLMTTGGQPEEAGRMVGHRYVFAREAQAGGPETIEVRWVAGRLTEAKVTGPVVPSPPTGRAPSSPVEGAPCERGTAPFCLDEYTVAECQNGHWRLTHCRPATCFTGPTGAEPSCAGPPAP